MHLRRFILALALILPRLASFAQAPSPAALANPYGDLNSFAGGVWTAEAPGGVHIDLRFAVAANHQGLRFDSEFVKGDKRRPYVSGMYGWDPVRACLLMIYTDSAGSLTQGTVTVTGNVLLHELVETNRDGTTDSVRVRLTRESADAFTNEITLLKDGAWVPVATVHYIRHP